MAHTRNTISDLERVVYDLAEAGALDAAHAVLYPRPIGKLVRAGLLRRREDGVYEAIRAATDTRPPPAQVVRPSAPPPAPGAAPRESVPVARIPPKAAPPAPPAEPKAPPMGTLVVRVPQEWLDMLDAMGPDRSNALRATLGRALANGSGARLRKAGS